MRYTVYHWKNTKYRGNGKYPDDYEKVAVIETVGLEKVFEKTNHIDKDWTENEEVAELFEPMPRSTSVGDVIINGNGIKFVVEPFGFKLYSE